MIIGRKNYAFIQKDSYIFRFKIFDVKWGCGRTTISFAPAAKFLPKTKSDSMWISWLFFSASIAVWIYGFQDSDSDSLAGPKGVKKTKGVSKWKGKRKQQIQVHLDVDVKNSSLMQQKLRSRKGDFIKHTASKAKVALRVKQRVTKTVNCEPRQNLDQPVRKSMVLMWEFNRVFWNMFIALENRPLKVVSYSWHIWNILLSKLSKRFA